VRPQVPEQLLDLLDGLAEPTMIPDLAGISGVSVATCRSSASDRS